MADISPNRARPSPYRRDVRIFRATVRGQFDGLDDDQQAELRAVADDHDILDATFTREGTFVFSPALTWINLRYELRSADEDTDAEAEAAAIQLAEQRLAAMGLAAKHLRVDLMDMASIWQD
jgi:Family of unknown function (DUF6204)